MAGDTVPKYDLQKEMQTGPKKSPGGTAHWELYILMPHNVENFRKQSSEGKR